MNASHLFTHIAQTRKSVRAFLPKVVDDTALERIFSDALTTPSNCNTQPWIVHVASGKTIEKLREALPKAHKEGRTSPDFPYSGKYEGHYKDRQYATAYALYHAMGIRREDKEKRQEATLRNFLFFDAPHVAFLFLPKPFGIREAGDVGMFAQTLMLSMTANGIGSCAQTALSLVADPIREILNVSAENQLLFGISFGYEDTENPANLWRTERENINELIHFHS